MLTTLNKKNAKKGFTLTELAIVIAVIAILVAVLVPTFTSILSKAKESNAIQTAKNASTSYTIAEEEVLADGSVIVVVDGSTYYYFIMESGVPYDVTDSDNSSTLSSYSVYASISSSISASSSVAASTGSNQYSLGGYGTYDLYDWNRSEDGSSYNGVVYIYILRLRHNDFPR